MNFNEVQFTDSTENIKASKVLIVASETRGEKWVGAKGIIVDHFVSNLESLLNKKSSIKNSKTSIILSIIWKKRDNASNIILLLLVQSLRAYSPHCPNGQSIDASLPYNHCFWFYIYQGSRLNRIFSPANPDGCEDQSSISEGGGEGRQIVGYPTTSPWYTSRPWMILMNNKNLIRNISHWDIFHPRFEKTSRYLMPDYP